MNNKLIKNKYLILLYIKKMLHFWTTWNLMWFLGSKTGIFNDSIH